MTKIIESTITIASEMNKKIAYSIHYPSNDCENQSVVKNKNTIIFCLPSLGDVKEEYRYLIPLLLNDGYKVIAVDHRGLGRSDVGFSSYCPEDCGNDVIKLIDEILVSTTSTMMKDNDIVNACNIIIIGNSYAGASAVWIASERPNVIRGIILIDAFVVRI